MAKAKKPQLLDYKNAVYYYASEEEFLHPNDEIWPDATQEGAIRTLREDSDELETIYLYEIKCIGKYKVNFKLEKLD